jgi:hypothetical protein
MKKSRNYLSYQSGTLNQMCDASARQIQSAKEQSMTKTAANLIKSDLNL